MQIQLFFEDYFFYEYVEYVEYVISSNFDAAFKDLLYIWNLEL